jgi:homoserine dehydrogenase
MRNQLPSTKFDFTPNGQAKAEHICKVALVGFGTVGSSVARILIDREGKARGRTDRSRPGLLLTHIYNRGIARKRVDWLPPEVVWTENIDDILSSKADIVVEVMGGLQPTEEWVRRALASDKSVVTANKQLIAHCGLQLTALAQQMHQHIEFGASVAGGVPVISGVHEGLAGDELFKVFGILNGTCNYILSQMESAGVAFDKALAEAQKLGFAEADPTDDIDGLDARAKLTILARAGLHCDVGASAIAARSIAAIEAIDFEYANQLGCTIRQISRAELKDNRLFAAVEPALVELNSPLARVEGSKNLVMATGIYGGETVFGGHGAGGHPTAVAVVSDILAIARKKAVQDQSMQDQAVRDHATQQSSNSVDAPKKQTAENFENLKKNDGENMRPHLKTPEVTSDFISKHYLRFVVKDRPGIIASLATILAQHKVNIDSVRQKPHSPKAHLPLMITLEECPTSLVDQALHQIDALDFMAQPCLRLPIL